MMHIKYLIYLLKHKWFVFIECFRLGILWRGVTHDLSKFSILEWLPYANKFFGRKEWFPSDQDGFNGAWEHHWQYWVSPVSHSCRIMSYGATREMVADWIAMGKTQENTALDYYIENRDKILLAPLTRKTVEDLLGYDN